MHSYNVLPVVTFRKFDLQYKCRFHYNNVYQVQYFVDHIFHSTVVNQSAVINNKKGSDLCTHIPVYE